MGAPSLSASIQTRLPFEVTSKRRKGFPSETQVKKGRRVVHGHKELTEKLGRNDPCPCGSRRLFQRLLPRQGQVLMASTVMTTKIGRASCRERVCQSV